jgi:lysyl-tRNA synthetase class 2
LDAEGLRARAKVLRALRAVFDARGYLEVPTPALVPSPALEEHLHALRAQDGQCAAGFLRTSPEFALKRALASGLGRIYEIGPCFRGREHGDWHRREFTMCEWYQAGAELPELMDEVELLVTAAAAALGRSAAPFRRTTVRALFLERLGLDLARASAEDLSPVEEGWDDAFMRRWVSDIEPSLTGAVFVSDWPASQAALARVWTDGDWPVAARFELYLHGVELANAFLELTDPGELRRRFLASRQARVAAGEEPHPMDEALIAATAHIPRTAGIAMGLDRLVAALIGWSSIGPGRTDG